jgi:beta-lactamase regulating signal transducer with metallopeptidase domain
MTPEAGSIVLPNMLSCIGEAAIRSVALALVVALVLRAVRIKNVRVGLMVWTGVLYAALAMPLLSVVLPKFSVAMLPGRAAALPIEKLAESVGADRSVSSTSGSTDDSLPASPSVVNAAAIPKAVGEGKRASSLFPLPSGDSGAGLPNFKQAPTAASAAPARGLHISLPLLVVAVYGFIALFMLARLITGLILSVRLRRSAVIVTDADIAAVLNKIALAASPFDGSRPVVGESNRISVPVGVGAIAPVILLPASWREWGPQKLEAVLAHELSHVQRRDGLTQLFSAFHRCFFWFSPLSWWLHRRLLELAEQASDDSALLVVRDRTFYAEVLLGFFDSLSTARGRWVGVSMARGAEASRRVERILNENADWSPRIRRAAVMAVVILAIPAALLAASVKLVGQSTSTPAVPAPEAAKAVSSRRAVAPPAMPASPPEPDEALAPTVQVKGGTNDPANELMLDGPGVALSDIQEPQPPPAPPSPSAVPPEPAEAIAPLAPVVGSVGVAGSVGLGSSVGIAPATTGGQYNATEAQYYATEGRYAATAGQDSTTWLVAGLKGDSFVIVTEGSSSVRMSGSTDALKRAMALRSKIKGSFIWFSHQGRGFVITDLTFINSVKDLFSPEDELSRQQDDLSAKQDALSRKQDELSRQEDEVRVDVPDMTADFNRLAERMKGAKTQSELSELQSELSRLQSRFSELQSRASVERSKLSGRQSELSREQSELSQQESRLSAAQSRAFSEGFRKLRQMLDRAVSSGDAHPEP